MLVPEISKVEHFGPSITNLNVKHNGGTKMLNFLKFQGLKLNLH